jgi:hypothetical protein
MGTDEFVTRLIYEFPNIFLKCSDDQIFFNIYKKAVFSAEALPSLLTSVKNTMKKGLSLHNSEHQKTTLKELPKIE